MDKKKEIIIGVAVIVVIVGGYFAYVWIRSKTSTTIPNAANTAVGTQTSLGTVTEAGVVAATGTSPISSNGTVIVASGTAAVNNVTPGAPTAPQQSNPITSATAIPSSAVKLTVSVSGGFTPNAFTVTAGAPVTVSVTSGDQNSHVFAFEDASLSAVAVGVGPGETRAITFNAPTKAGAYKFYSNIPGQSGEAGVMTVK